MKTGLYALYAATLAVGALAVASLRFAPAPADGAAVRTTDAAVAVGDGDTALSANEPISPLPDLAPLPADQVALGKRLFRDARLSHDGSVSCASCHDLARGGAEQRGRSLGVGGREGAVNAPTVLNAAFNFRQFWDGRAATLEEQIDGPITNENEMATSWPAVLEVLRGDQTYVDAFARAFADGVTKENAKRAIVSFERSLVTPSRFDRYLRGDQTAITERERDGYRLFKELGCTSCHQGVNVGGNMFQTMGAMGDYFGDRGDVTHADLGRFNVTGRDRDRFRFKVPSLRNVALTAPYFHDGYAKTLEQAVEVMARYQLGYELTEHDVELLVAFLHSLTGEGGSS
jgi:cytochrome c peroxidase